MYLYLDFNNIFLVDRFRCSLRLLETYPDCLLPPFSETPTKESSSLPVPNKNTSAKTINLPFLADSINEGTIAEILKSNQTVYLIE